LRLADEAAARAAGGRVRAVGVVETQWQDNGRLVRVQVADPDGDRVEVYAHLAARCREAPAGSAHQVKGLDRRGP
jgi:hypothetical protein